MKRTCWVDFSSRARSPKASLHVEQSVGCLPAHRDDRTASLVSNGTVDPIYTPKHVALFRVNSSRMHRVLQRSYLIHDWLADERQVLAEREDPEALR